MEQPASGAATSEKPVSRPRGAVKVMPICNAIYVVRLNPRWLGGLL